ncbi:MAG: hypothetical protein DHS20C01_24560 [marine bacterium B5-7]|nr:MAG: hypothetical protein DHS20C01_24560 [marine bacterium B5-7]
MIRPLNHIPDSCAVAIVGAGPSGLSAAIELKRLGVNDVHVIERESAAGGIPRHCGHPPFGMREFNRIYKGPTYAKKLVAQALANNVALHLDTTVVSLGRNGLLHLSSPHGSAELLAERVILCTGVRETPRSARLVSGQRPLGIVTTGALQSMVYLYDKRPFRMPVIVGSELVSFSALLTCRHAGIKPVSMIEANDRPTAWNLSRLLPLASGTQLRLNSSIQRILGRVRVEGVEVIDRNGTVSTESCDGIIFSGRFVPESTLARLSHLDVDPDSQGPVIDNFGRCSDPAYLAAGNLLRAVETAGWCWQEGRRVASTVHRSLEGQLPDSGEYIRVIANHPIIKYVLPQRLSINEGSMHSDTHPVQHHQLQLRVSSTAKGVLSIVSGERTILMKRINTLPERRILVNLPSSTRDMVDDTIRIDFNPS